MKKILIFEDVRALEVEVIRQSEARSPDPQALVDADFEFNDETVEEAKTMEAYWSRLEAVYEPSRLSCLLEPTKEARFGLIRKIHPKPFHGKLSEEQIERLMSSDTARLENWLEEWDEILPETPLEAARRLAAMMPSVKVFGPQQKELREEAGARRTTPKALLRELFVTGLFLAKGKEATPQRIRLEKGWVKREGRISIIEPRLLGVYKYLQWFNARAANWARDSLGRLEAPAQKGKRPCLSCGKTELLAGKAQICPACGVGMPRGWSSLTWDKPLSGKDSARFPPTPETHLEEKSLWAALDGFLRPEEQALCKSLQAGAFDEEIATTLGLSPVNERKRRQRLKEKIKAFLLS